MIYCVFPFFNELDLLEIRLTMQYPFVDKFIISESDKTFSGKSKPYYLYDQKFKPRFEKYFDKIGIVNYLHQGEAWATEAESRNCIGRYMKTVATPKDWIIYGDADEIQDLSKADFDTEYTQSFDMKLYYYYLNCEMNLDWKGSTMFRYYMMAGKKLSEMRGIYETLVLNGGWHWSYLGGAEKIVEKIGAYSHQELNVPEFTDKEKIAVQILNGEDIFNRGYSYKFVDIDESYPQYIRDNTEKYKHLIK